MTISHNCAISPPDWPVRPTVVRPRRRAATRPPSTFGERPEVELRYGLERLTRAGLLFASGSPPDAIYTFKHALVQDVAYETLLRSRRQDLHARIVMEIETHSPEIGEQRPELLAHHATQAGLIERAVVQWGKAGRKSVSGSAMAEAVSQLRRGLELVPALPDTPKRQRLELELQSALGGALVAVAIGSLIL